MIVSLLFKTILFCIMPAFYYFIYLHFIYIRCKKEMGGKAMFPTKRNRSSAMVFTVLIHGELLVVEIDTKFCYFVDGTCIKINLFLRAILCIRVTRPVIQGSSESLHTLTS